MFVARVLRSGGLLIVTTPCHGYFRNIALAIMGQWDDHHTALWCGRPMKLWSRVALTMLHDNGVRGVDVSGVGRLPYLWKSMVIVAQRIWRFAVLTLPQVQ
jgi:hypothetical protein